MLLILRVGRHTGDTAGDQRFVVLLGVSLEGLLPCERFVALVTGVGGASHCCLQSEVEFDAMALGCVAQ